jgi:DNA mismatch repair protein MutL
MGQIVVLNENMVNMIAAGEVIERPASVVKELVENSIDSGATEIAVSIEDGGRKSISVVDNGCGMDAGDLVRAFEPHATSKIKTSSDLQHISTLGFRGEALASIASVAQVKAVSRGRDSDAGNCLEIDCGQRSRPSPCSTDYGTTIHVRDIFYKLPARRKFLKTANTEMGHIVECFKRFALAKNDLDLKLISNGRQIYHISGKSGIHSRIAELFGTEISENLIETESEEKGAHIFAMLGKESISRTTNKFQYTFLNGRFIRDKFISHAIREAYRGYLEPDRFPTVFLFMQMPCENFYVNVHPTKNEVRFYNANLVHSQILASLREKLLATDFDVDAKLAEPSARSEQPHRSRQIQAAMADFFKRYQSDGAQQQLNFRSKSENGEYHKPAEQRQPAKTYRPTAIQIHDCFIIAQTDEGFVIIDQHALHERIMYEDLSRRIKNNRLEAQKLLIPESFELTGSQAEAISNHTELIERLGIELVPFGPKTMAIQAFPTILAKVPPVDFVVDLLDLITDKDCGFDAEKLLDEVLNMAACKAAIKAGQRLCESEIQQLLSDREDVGHASRCPHGRPTTIKFSLEQLEKQFNRT